MIMRGVPGKKRIMLPLGTEISVSPMMAEMLPFSAKTMLYSGLGDLLSIILAGAFGDAISPPDIPQSVTVRYVSFEVVLYVSGRRSLFIYLLLSAFSVLYTFIWNLSRGKRKKYAFF